jgi:oligoribonuclease (3'-5' exoribonuclease)
MLAIFLDIETTGLNPRRHRSLEIALKVCDLESWEVRAEYSQLIEQPSSVWEAADPVSLQVNGMSQAREVEGISESQVGEEITHLFDQLQINRSNAVFICQNPSFDRSFFCQMIDVDTQEARQWPYHWLDLASMYWVTVAAHSSDKRLSKDAIACHFNLPPEQRPHRAMQGVDHLISCYREVVEVNSAALSL